MVFATLFSRSSSSELFDLRSCTRAAARFRACRAKSVPAGATVEEGGDDSETDLLTLSTDFVSEDFASELVALLTGTAAKVTLGQLDLRCCLDKYGLVRPITLLRRLLMAPVPLPVPVAATAMDAT